MADALTVPNRTDALASIETIIGEASNGRMFILVDDADPDNEGDLVLPAQMVTPQAVNFMAAHCRGIVCLALAEERAVELGLAAMNAPGGAADRLRFTRSIEAKVGVTTGISAADRARTIAVAVDATNGRDAIVSPGHVFPLISQPGGVLMRAGRTEGAVDVARLAGLNASGVICRILNENGDVARFDDLWAFAQRHGIKIGAIRDLIAYRRRHDHLVERVTERAFVTSGASDWKIIRFRNRIDGSHHDVLVKGRIEPGSATVVRMHRLSLIDDILGAPGPRGKLLERAIKTIEAGGRGVVVLLQPSAAKGEQRYGRDWTTPDMDLRAYGFGAQILADLGIHEMILLTNEPSNIVALDGWGISIVAQRSIPT